MPEHKDNFAQALSEQYRASAKTRNAIQQKRRFLIIAPIIVVCIFAAAFIVREALLLQKIGKNEQVLDASMLAVVETGVANYIAISRLHGNSPDPASNFPNTVMPLGLETSGYCEDAGDEPKIISEIYVKELLKAPATSEFDPTPLTTRRGPCLYEVFGWVDAQNSFGALIRTSYTFSIRYDADTRHWMDLRANVD